MAQKYQYLARNQVSGLNWPVLGQKICNFDPKISIYGAKSQFFVLESKFLSTGHITSIPGATTFPFGSPRKKFIFWGSPWFWANLGQYNFARISTLIFYPKLTFLAKYRHLWPIWSYARPKNNAGITEKRPFLRFAEKRFFWPKIRFFPQKTPEIC